MLDVSLPIDEVLPQLIASLREHGQVILEAPPGAGKSTRVPAALVEAGFTSHGQLWMLEPRRVAARAVAARMAQLDGSSLGQRFGYAVRFERRFSEATQALVVTEGMLLRRLQRDPLLDGINVVILDEFHERSVEADLCLAMLKEVRQVRDDLYLVVMSATLQSDALARYLDAPIIRSQGRTFPVQVEHLGRTPADVIQAAADVAIDALNDPAHEGDILIFMPGAREIRDTIARLEATCARHRVLLAPLYGALSLDEQLRAIEPSSQPKIIVATNIAETSLTVEGVTLIIDSGLVKQLVSSASGLDRLELVQISQASAKQRAGRAGRVRPGKAIRLWTTATEDAMPAFDEAPLTRVDLSAAALEVIAWSGNDPSSFDWFEAPPAQALRRAVKLLIQLGALSPDNTNLTDTGRAMLGLPASPRLARLVTAGAQRGVLEDAALLAATLSEAEAELTHAPGQALTRCELQDALISLKRRGVPAQIKRAQAQLIEQLKPLLATLKQETSPVKDADSLTRAILAAWPDRICIQRGHDKEHYVLGGLTPAIIAKESRVERAPLLVAPLVSGALNLRHQSSGNKSLAMIRFASVVSLEWLKESFPDLVTQAVELEFDAERARVMAFKRLRFDGIVVQEEIASVNAHADDELVARAIATAASRDLWRAFEPDKEDLQLLGRLRFLGQHMPELGLPILTRYPPEGGYAEPIQELLVQWCWGQRSFAQLKQTSLSARLMQSLTHEQRRALEAHAPSHFQVPSGSLIRLSYEDEEAPPILAARIQEMFGLLQTPTIAGGKVKLMIHLLAPNYRPAQVTQDLDSFWRVTYPEVRKELRARYPKHPWPEDPLTAKALRK